MVWFDGCRYHKSSCMPVIQASSFGFWFFVVSCYQKAFFMEEKNGFFIWIFWVFKWLHLNHWAFYFFKSMVLGVDAVLLVCSELWTCLLVIFFKLKFVKNKRIYWLFQLIISKQLLMQTGSKTTTKINKNTPLQAEYTKRRMWGYLTQHTKPIRRSELFELSNFPLVFHYFQLFVIAASS